MSKPRTILCAPDSFKGSLSAPAVAAALALGVRDALPGAVVDECPLGDGGEGTAAILTLARGGQWHVGETVDPLGRGMEAPYGVVRDDDGEVVVIVELAAASGLMLLREDERGPMDVSSYGTGRLIRAALEAQSGQRVILGLGGSATVDGGAGMAQALGVKFYREDGEEMVEAITGGRLGEIARVDVSGSIVRGGMTVLCDVRNPLLGADGAASVYGPQKGASAAEVEQLEAGLQRLAEVALRDGVASCAEDAPGAGAAGGAGFGAAVLLGGELLPGADFVMDQVGMDERLAAADLVITGEGQLDGQSAAGKVATSVLERARRVNADAQVVAIVGRCAGEVSGMGFDVVVSLEEDFGMQRAVGDAAACVRAAAAQVIDALRK